MSTQTLTIEEFSHQLAQCNILLLAHIEQYVQVVIRGVDGDYAVASVHRDKGTLIFDLGQPLDGQKGKV